MKLRTPVIVLIAAVTLSAQSPAQSLEVQLQRAEQKETASGDLKAAIASYQKIAASAGSNHAIAAQALLREAEAYQKLGDAQAQKVYQQIVSQYGDQKDAAAVAQSRLKATSGGPGGNRLVWEIKPGQTGDVTAVSPDGRYLSYTSPGGSIEDVFLRDLVTGTDRKLTSGSTDEYPDEAAFSPDGKQIAYIWYHGKGKARDLQHSDLRILNLNGNGATPRIIGNSNVDYDGVVWSPDGKWLLTDTSPKEPGGAAKFALISTQDGSSRVLDFDGGAGLSFSPDSKYLAYDRRSKTAGQRDVFVLSIASGREMPVALEGDGIRIWGWTKEGRLLFTSNGGGLTNLSAVAMTDGKVSGTPVLIKSDIGNAYPIGATASGALYYQKAISGPPAQLEIAPFDFTTGKVLASPSVIWSAAQRNRVLEQYDWSPDGKYFAFTTPDAPLGRRGPAIVIRSMETGVTQILPSEGIQLARAEAKWAPDSRTLLASGPGEMYVIDTGTDRISTFKVDDTQAKGWVSQPRWSPDGKKIYFAANDIEGTQAFFESDPDLKNLRKIAGNVPGGLNLTPDGRRIITPVANSEPLRIVGVPVEGGEPKLLYSGPVKGNIFVSPDGKYVAFVNATASTRKVTSASIMSVGGGDVRDVFKVDPPLSVAMGMWAPDSKSFFIRTLDAAGQQVAMWRVPVDGGQVMKVEIGLNLDQYSRFATASPKGNWIAYVRGVPPGPQKHEVWVLDNFLPSAK